MKFEATRDPAAFSAIVDELGAELGDRFAKSIANWCGVGERPYPLPTWQIYLTSIDQVQAEPIGICSYYRQIEDSPGRFWIGWIGVRPKFRRQGHALTMLRFVLARLRQLGAEEIRVYTDNPAAVALYRRMGMAVDGTFSQTGLTQAAAKGDEILLTLRTGEETASNLPRSDTSRPATRQATSAPDHTDG